MKKKYVSPSGRLIRLAEESNLLADSLQVDETPQNNLRGDSNRKRFTAWDYMDE